jgi:hypothetical protein
LPHSQKTIVTLVKCAMWHVITINYGGTASRLPTSRTSKESGAGYDMPKIPLHDILEFVANHCGQFFFKKIHDMPK